MNDDIEKLRINTSKGTLALLDAEMNQVAFRTFKSITERKKIMGLWNRTYRLEDKQYCIIIRHN